MGPHADTYIALAINRSYISDFYLRGSRFQSRPTHQLPYFVLTWFILILGTRWKRVVNLTPRPLYRRGRAFCSHSVRGWVGPRAVRMFGEGTSLGWAIQPCWTVNDMKRSGGLIQNTVVSS